MNRGLFLLQSINEISWCEKKKKKSEKTILKVIVAVSHIAMNTAWNTVTSSNFLGWKFFGNKQFPQSFVQSVPISGPTVQFHKIFNIWKLAQFSVFYGEKACNFIMRYTNFMIFYFGLLLKKKLQARFELNLCNNISSHNYV